MQTPETPLSKAMAGQAPRSSADPLQALEAGRRQWLAGERISMKTVADEIGINRATLFRWVGSRDIFVGEVIWSLYQEVLEAVSRKTSGEGPDYVVALLEQVLQRLVANKPLHQFILQDPEYAIRILTSKSSVFQGRSVSAKRKIIATQSSNTNWIPPIDQGDLAFLIVRIAESFLYGDVISGQKTDIAQTTMAFRLLLSGRS